MYRRILACALLLAFCVSSFLFFSHRFAFVTLDADGNAEHVEKSFFERYEGRVRAYYSDGEIVTYENGFTVLHPLAGVMLSPPEHTTTDVYALTIDALTAGRRVMIIYLDGFSYASYEAAAARGDLPVLQSYAAHCASAMYPTITPVNYAAMVTGKTPKHNGVTARGIHDLTAETMFDAALAMGKRVTIAEGDTQILHFSVPQTLNLDMDEDGDTDTECVASALPAVLRGDELIFVHLHGIDDVSHKTGPDSAETRQKISATNGYIAALTENFVGRVIIIADHGQHEKGGDYDPAYEDKRGVHGAFAASDIFVPLLTLDKEMKVE